MAFYPGNENDRKDYRPRDDEDFRSNVYRPVFRFSRNDSQSPKLEDEKKMRREIANSNERRRMQSINAGFQSLRALLPKGEGDKLSKAAILQGTVDYVQQLEQEKSFLLSQNMKLSRSVHSSSCNDSDGSCNNDLLPPLIPKRKRRKTDLALLDEGIGSASPSSQSEGEERGGQELLVQLRQQLQQERELRVRLEGELRGMHRSTPPSDHHYTTEQIIAIKSQPTPSHLQRRESPHSRLTIEEHEIAHPTATRNAVVHSEQQHSSRQPPSPVVLPPLTYRPGQNLAAIVEAIRHVEGYHMFQDDAPPSPGQFQTSIDERSLKIPSPVDERLLKREISSPIDDRLLQREIPSPVDDRSFKSHIIKCAPVVQNRAGVIVSNTS